MIQIFFIILIILLVVFLIALVTVGLCIGMAYLTMYFIPSLNWGVALVPAAILTTALLFILGAAIQLWLKTPLLSLGYNEDGEPELPPVGKVPLYRKRNRR